MCLVLYSHGDMHPQSGITDVVLYDLVEMVLHEVPQSPLERGAPAMREHYCRVNHSSVDYLGSRGKKLQRPLVLAWGKLYTVSFTERCPVSKWSFFLRFHCK